MQDPKDEVIYTEEKVILIKPLKARIFSDDYDKQEFYNLEGDKVIFLRKKLIKP